MSENSKLKLPKPYKIFGMMNRKEDKLLVSEEKSKLKKTLILILKPLQNLKLALLTTLILTIHLLIGAFGKHI
jgi:hypothetical protein